MMTCNKLGLFIHSLVNAVVILGHIQKAKMGSIHSLYYVPNCCTIYSRFPTSPCRDYTTDSRFHFF